MRGRRTAVVAALVAVAACSPSASTSTGPSAAPTRTATVAPVGPTPSPVVSPQDAAVAAYQAYTAAVVTALQQGDAQLPALQDAAAGRALRNARRRVAANRDEGVVVTGDLEPSVTATDVEVTSNGNRAELTDCVLNGLAHVDADNPDDVLVEATGWRQPVEATLAHGDDGWRVTGVEVPLTDGSGPVPAPPEEAPLLRGPAQAEAPPSCVPAPLESELIDRYLEFQQAYDEALGLDGRGPAHPNSQALRQTATDPQLAAAREYVSTLRADGHAVRGEPDRHDVWGVAAFDFDRSGLVYDCVTLSDNAIVDLSSGDTVAENDEGGVDLRGGLLRRVDGQWMAAEVTTIEEGLEECTSPG